VSDRIPSDHDAVTSHRVRYGTVGHTSRPEVVLPDGIDVGPGDVVRLSLEGTGVHAAVVETLSGETALQGAFDNARLARSDGEGEDRLQDWAADAGLEAGDQLLLDVVTAGYAYGLRRPGERVVYEAPDPPDAGLSDIARDLAE
jgi:hypothetical protein